jgi:chromosome partitioning protein
MQGFTCVCFFFEKREVRMTCYVVFNQKGGVGKSTLTTNLAAASAANGKRVLVVDLDAQANTTRYLIGSDVETNYGAFALFSQALKVSLYVQQVSDWIIPTPYEGLSLLPAHAELDALHDKLSAKHKIFKLREALSSLEIDEMWIDTPPVMNFYTLSAMIAADACIVPFDGDRFSLDAAKNVAAYVKEIREDHHSDLRLLGAVMNGYQSRSKSIQEGLDALKEVMPVLEPYLPHSVVVKASRMASRPLVHFDKSHKLTLAFDSLLSTINSSMANFTR